MLSRMFDQRCRGYEAVGYKIRLPASAVAGWPTEVPLPVDPRWKHDYAASVRRLVREGVDTPLADLFVHVARAVTTDSKGVERARSASEAFLYRRMETLPETSGLFHLNANLPISFDGWGHMEVDLLCADALLQENGYFVLRFLVEDVGKHLDSVLDAILRALANRRRADLH